MADWSGTEKGRRERGFVSVSVFVSVFVSVSVFVFVLGGRGGRWIGGKYSTCIKMQIPNISRIFLKKIYEVDTSKQ